mmetsp:Transcript_110500/g.323250  ORF Transcript_110500/g.323250 Transcript_110500/m.323250 type:complete len:106 (+) Transcript_110500:884-1201(+)
MLSRDGSASTAMGWEVAATMPNTEGIPINERRRQPCAKGPTAQSIRLFRRYPLEVASFEGPPKENAVAITNSTKAEGHLAFVMLREAGQARRMTTPTMYAWQNSF